MLGPKQRTRWSMWTNFLHECSPKRLVIALGALSLLFYGQSSLSTSTAPSDALSNPAPSNPNLPSIHRLPSLHPFYSQPVAKKPKEVKRQRPSCTLFKNGQLSLERIGGSEDFAIGCTPRKDSSTDQREPECDVTLNGRRFGNGKKGLTVGNRPNRQGALVSETVYTCRPR